ncbi:MULTISPECIES: NAD(+) diphosphatase [unclassified Lentimonas]|uniref:NAD(+) diphosphatase n=1 Tax=unclassified Lentimonas TaxID=2630993 RepID=UPI001321D38D|nr:MULTISPECIES: NAD(+) diphosphatase [unclassified Lentimonas]CAA6678708.1 NADH pyrophosphatase (EC [Lentimonas sp. CC4]CAA6683694.1 NADH pyrophosphatase (EC [Lentimonas sp. CC6]CAA7074458.1 NADH pyrophosphatase (EC [Lentimonas sp. CC4]CAA7169068.1 NADH pyrophosphatase (EC [Lentimonas sp. CC21]CAA7180524.1 NADH pyrophosphatase (EC [Lentimonas sp. CC8]
MNDTSPNRTPLSPYFLDRASTLRDQPDWLEAQLKSDTTRCLIAHGAQLLCRANAPEHPIILTPYELGSAINLSADSVFLGTVEGIAYFAVLVQSAEQAAQLCQQFSGSFEPSVSRAPHMERADKDILSLACFMGYWHSRHRHCGKCGSQTTVVSAGHHRICSDSECAQHFFPNMDPAVIVLVEHDGRALLGRQARWREGMYSTLAGFVEPGETIEAAVAREVHEEAGVPLEAIEYQSSQSWLFPNSLMLGFKAKATSPEITIDPNELESAAWFTREHVRANPDMLPNKASISYALIQSWLQSEDRGVMDQ